jgi:hypothetical protein
MLKRPQNFLKTLTLKHPNMSQANISTYNPLQVAPGHFIIVCHPDKKTPEIIVGEG